MLEFPPAEPKECTLAFDLDEHRFLFISNNVITVLGRPAADFYSNTNLLYENIDPHYQESIKTQVGKLAEGATIELHYKFITPIGPVKDIYERKSLVVDEKSGHKILLSVIRDYLTEKPRLHDGTKLREKFLNSVIDSQTNFLIRFDINGCFTFANKKFLKTLGYKNAEIISKPYSIVTLPQEMAMLEKAFVNCVTHPGKIIRLAHKKMAKNGDIYDTEWEFISVANDEGEVKEVQGIGHDVTHKHLIENEIKQTSKKLDTFIESINDYFFILDNEWKFIRVNAAFEKVSGKMRDELVGAVIWDAFPIVSGTAFEKAYREAAEKKIIIQFIGCIEGAQAWLDTSVFPSTEGLTVFMKDISQEKRAWEEASRAQNSLAALINNTDDLIWSVDTGTRYVYMNKAYRNMIARITGSEPKEGEYSYLHKGYTDKEIEKWDEYYHRALAGERYTIINESTDPVTNEVLSFEISFNPIYKVKGDITGVGCFSHNITELLATEKAITDQNERLRHIASLSSHELRRPVASMLGLINIMDRGNFFNPDNKEVIEHILTVGNEIDEVIRLIIDKTFVGGPSKNKYQAP